MQLPIQIRVQPQPSRVSSSAAIGVMPSSGIRAQEDSRCSNSSTVCNRTTCKDGQMSCNLGRYYFKCDC